MGRLIYQLSSRCLACARQNERSPAGGATAIAACEISGTCILRHPIDVNVAKATQKEESAEAAVTTWIAADEIECDTIAQVTFVRLSKDLKELPDFTERAATVPFLRATDDAYRLDLSSLGEVRVQQIQVSFRYFLTATSAAAHVRPREDSDPACCASSGCQCTFTWLPTPETEHHLLPLPEIYTALASEDASRNKGLAEQGRETGGGWRLRVEFTPPSANAPHDVFSRLGVVVGSPLLFANASRSKRDKAKRTFLGHFEGERLSDFYAVLGHRSLHLAEASGEVGSPSSRSEQRESKDGVCCSRCSYPYRILSASAKEQTTRGLLSLWEKRIRAAFLLCDKMTMIPKLTATKMPTTSVVLIEQFSSVAKPSSFKKQRETTDDEASFIQPFLAVLSPSGFARGAATLAGNQSHQLVLGEASLSCALCTSFARLFLQSFCESSRPPHENKDNPSTFSKHVAGVFCCLVGLFSVLGEANGNTSRSAREREREAHCALSVLLALRSRTSSISSCESDAWRGAAAFAVIRLLRSMLHLPLAEVFAHVRKATRALLEELLEKRCCAASLELLCCGEMRKRSALCLDEFRVVRLVASNSVRITVRQAAASSRGRDLQLFDGALTIALLGITRANDSATTAASSSSTSSLSVNVLTHLVLRLEPTVDPQSFEFGLCAFPKEFGLVVVADPYLEVANDVVFVATHESERDTELLRLWRNEVKSAGEDEVNKRIPLFSEKPTVSLQDFLICFAMQQQSVDRSEGDNTASSSGGAHLLAQKRGRSGE